MANRSQYGIPVFIRNFEHSSAAPLKPMDLAQTAGAQSHYDEAWLQQLIFREPSLLPVSQIENAFTDLSPVCVELPTATGPVDILFMTPRGNIAIVECKLYRNPEARRKVIAQIIDYATAMSRWSYSELEKAARDAGAFTGAEKSTLYELVSPGGEMRESEFVDAVSRNLRRGRFLLLIVGDGIREEMESMAEFLQRYAGLHFYLALVELAFFEFCDGGCIIQPRVLAKTTIIERAVVSIDPAYVDKLAIRLSPSVISKPEPAVSRTLTQELFTERLESKYPGIGEQLKVLFDQLQNYSVTPEFGTDSMILRWRPDTGKTWNLSTIYSNGGLSTDILGQQAKNAALLNEHKAFLERIRNLFPDASIRKTPKETAWYVKRQGRGIDIGDLLSDAARMQGWLDAIAAFQKAVNALEAE